MKLHIYLEGIILALFTLVVYLFTINPLTKPYSFFTLILCLVVCAGLYSMSEYQRNPAQNRYKTTFTMLTYTFITALFLWIGSAGWYFSPFFYLLYLVALSLAFLFSSSAAFSFVIVLIGIILPNVNGVTVKFDIVTVGSLLVIVPLAYFMSKFLIRLREKDKKILVLENDIKRTENLVNDILDNKVTKLSADLREVVNDVKQLAMYIPKNKSPKDVEDARQDIVTLSEKALVLIKSFEETTTGRKILQNP